MTRTAALLFLLGRGARIAIECVVLLALLLPIGLVLAPALLFIDWLAEFERGRRA